MSGKCRPSLRPKTLENVKRSNLSITDKRCIEEAFRRLDEIVYCRECAWCASESDCTNPHSWYGCPVRPDHYCSYGERKE